VFYRRFDSAPRLHFFAEADEPPVWGQLWHSPLFWRFLSSIGQLHSQSWLCARHGDSKTVQACACVAEFTEFHFLALCGDSQ
jgi:hypothetical protein